MQWGEQVTVPMTDEIRKELDSIDWDNVGKLEDWNESEGDG